MRGNWGKVIAKAEAEHEMRMIRDALLTKPADTEKARQEAIRASVMMGQAEAREVALAEAAAEKLRWERLASTIQRKTAEFERISPTLATNWGARA